MLRISKAAMLRYDQTIVVAEVLDLFAIGGPQRWPTMDEYESLLGLGIDIEVCEVDATSDGLWVGWVRSVRGRTFDVLLLQLVNVGIEVWLSVVDWRGVCGSLRCGSRNA